MKLRSLIALGAFLLGILPILTLIAINLAGHIERHDQVSRQGLTEKASFINSYLRNSVAAVRQNQRQILSLSMLHRFIHCAEDVGICAAAGDELGSLLVQLNQNIPEILAIEITGPGVHPLFIARNGIGVLGQAAGALPSDRQIGVLPSGEAVRDLRPKVLQYRSPQTGQEIPALLINSPIAGKEGLSQWVLRMIVALEPLMPFIDNFTLVDNSGQDLYSHAGKGHEEEEILIRTRPFSPTGENNSHHIERLQNLLATQAPFFISLSTYTTVSWTPLLFTDAPYGTLWFAVLLDRSGAQQWKYEIIRNIVLILLSVGVAVFLIATFLAARMDNIRRDIVNGLQTTLTDLEKVSFNWKGPKELRGLGKELSALSERYVTTQEARAAAEAKLSDSENKFRNLAASARDAIIMVGPSGKISFWNDAAERIFGYHSSEAIGRYIHSLIAPRLTDTEGNLRSLEHLDLGPISKTLELTAGKKDTSTIPIELSLSEVQIREEWHTVWLIRDISERKMADELACQQQLQLIQADKMVSLGLLVSGVAHEINNPNSIALLNGPMLFRCWQSITPILERHFAENGDFEIAGLSYGEMREEIPRLFAELEESSRRIKTIVQDLKDYARKDGGDLPDRIDLNEVVRASLRLASNLITKATDCLHVEYADGLPAIRGHMQRLEQVVINLIHNSCEALRSKQEAVHISTGFDASLQSVQIVVRDEGRGIPEEHLQQITDPFFTTKRNLGGTGLGLSVSAGIVKEHGGMLQFYSKPGQGTVAIVSFPPLEEAS